MTTLQQSTICALAREVMVRGVEVDVSIPGSTVRRVYQFEGYEYQARRVAILLKSRGIPAKARRGDEYAAAFSRASRDLLVERAREARRRLDEYDAQAAQ